MDIIGTVKDIQPNAAKPTLELAFPRTDSGRLSSGLKVGITLVIEGVRWHGTMRNDGARDAYVHTRLQNGLGESATCTDVLTRIGAGHNTRLLFAVISPDTIRLDKIIAKGEQAHRERAANAGRSPSRSTLSVGRRPITTGDDTLPIRTSFPFGNCHEIRRLAETYWELITRREAAEERQFEHDFREARGQGFLSKELFVRVGRWKSTRQTQNYGSNAEETVRAATAEAFRARDDGSAVAALTRLRGVGLRTASAMLQWMRPDQFPILDVRVVGALGWPEPTSWEDLEFYSRVTERARTLARQCAVDLRTMDRALWTWDKLRSLGRL